MITGASRTKRDPGQRIRRLRRERGMSLAKIGQATTSPGLSSTRSSWDGRSRRLRVLRVIADRLGTHVDYLLEGRLPELDRELALERARVLLLRGEPRRALIGLRGIHGSSGRSAPTSTCRGRGPAQLGRNESAQKILDAERKVIASTATTRAWTAGAPFTGRAYSATATATRSAAAKPICRSPSGRPGPAPPRSARALPLGADPAGGLGPTGRR